MPAEHSPIATKLAEDLGLTAAGLPDSVPNMTTTRAKLLRLAISFSFSEHKSLSRRAHLRYYIKKVSDIFDVTTHYYANEAQKTPKEDQIRYRKACAMYQSAWDAEKTLKGEIPAEQALGAVGKMMPAPEIGLEEA
ncbi:hypothetical protein LshimejAT787_0905280 [Lyophyllum shimeji]|uniref:Uncharacterized protein n=1 Tax=Lyophyllum shimeji TaxID=47721 RepID=A0A9P3PTI6_LYOSH|nr:hypothetical protein LshimejAT787_0905280 [Lyophyllum shimeji]